MVEVPLGWIVAPLFSQSKISSLLLKLSGKKIVEGTQEEFEATLSQQKGKPQNLSQELLGILKKEYGEFEINFS